MEALAEDGSKFLSGRHGPRPQASQPEPAASHGLHTRGPPSTFAVCFKVGLSCLRMS